MPDNEELDTLEKIIEKIEYQVIRTKEHHRDTRFDSPDEGECRNKCIEGLRLTNFSVATACVATRNWSDSLDQALLLALQPQLKSDLQELCRKVLTYFDDLTRAESQKSVGNAQYALNQIKGCAAEIAKISAPILPLRAWHSAYAPPSVYEQHRKQHEEKLKKSLEDTKLESDKILINVEDKFTQYENKVAELNDRFKEVNDALAALTSTEVAKKQQPIFTADANKFDSYALLWLVASAISGFMLLAATILSPGFEWLTFNLLSRVSQFTGLQAADLQV